MFTTAIPQSILRAAGVYYSHTAKHSPSSWCLLQPYRKAFSEQQVFTTAIPQSILRAAGVYYSHTTKHSPSSRCLLQPYHKAFSEQQVFTTAIPQSILRAAGVYYSHTTKHSPSSSGDRNPPPPPPPTLPPPPPPPCYQSVAADSAVWHELPSLPARGQRDCCRLLIGCLLACLTSLQHACVSQGRIRSNKCYELRR